MEGSHKTYKLIANRLHQDLKACKFPPKVSERSMTKVIQDTQVKVRNTALSFRWGERVSSSYVV